MRVWGRLRPAQWAASIYQIDFGRLWRLGYRFILTDLDNTLAEWNAPAPPQLAAWLAELRGRGFAVCIVSNNGRERVSAFAGPLGLPAVWKAGKPRRRAYREALKQIGGQASQTVMIGDQVFTDILGGNRLGMHTVLVRPLHAREALRTRVLRLAERAVMRGMAPGEPGEEDGR